MLLIIGVIVLILGFIEYNKYITEQNSYGLVESEVSAVTINNGRTIVNFEFQLNGKYYFSDIFTEETFEIGDKQKIYYLKRDPSICKISLITVYKAVIIFVIGSIILLIGFIILIKYLLYVIFSLLKDFIYLSYFPILFVGKKTTFCIKITYNYSIIKN